VKKKYSAVLHGRLLQKSGLIDYPIGRDTVFGPPCFAIDSTSTGKEAITRYEVIEESDCCSKLELFPLTGRTHQLRLHTAAIGHPILGDFFYARPQIYKSAQRLMLHAEEVEFLHPVTNKRMHVVSKSAFDLTDFNHYFSRLD
jgi:tRNA pseudouridine32 synthase/23S rRNA pseudouridine746 synthase